MAEIGDRRDSDAMSLDSPNRLMVKRIFEDHKEERMEFTNSTLAGLMATIPSESEVAAERANLCMEERVSAARQTAYEDRVGAPDGWEDWRDNHLRYVQEEVRRRHPLSASFP